MATTNAKGSRSRKKKPEKRGKKRKRTHLMAVSSLRLPASSSSEWIRLGLREEWRDEATDDTRLVAFEPSEYSREAALREVVLPPPRARRRRSMLDDVSSSSKGVDV